jgi:hypothetical protein
MSDKDNSKTEGRFAALLHRLHEIKTPEFDFAFSMDSLIAAYCQADTEHEQLEIELEMARLVYTRCDERVRQLDSYVNEPRPPSFEGSYGEPLGEGKLEKPRDSDPESRLYDFWQSCEYGCGPILYVVNAEQERRYLNLDLTPHTCRGREYVNGVPTAVAS